MYRRCLLLCHNFTFCCCCCYCLQMFSNWRSKFRLMRIHFAHEFTERESTIWKIKTETVIFLFEKFKQNKLKNGVQHETLLQKILLCVVVMCVCEVNDGHNKNDNTIDMFLIFMHFHHPLFPYSSTLHTHRNRCVLRLRL